MTNMLDLVKGIFSNEEQENDVQKSVRNFLEKKLHVDNGIKMLYLLKPSDAKFLLGKLEHTKPTSKEWKTIHRLSRQSDNRTFDAPKHPISISVKELKVLEGKKRLLALAVSKKPALMWIELED